MQNFEQLQTKYGLQKPKQIKQRIIWNHLKALVLAQFPEGAKKLESFEHEFRTCEVEQKKEGR